MILKYETRFLKMGLTTLETKAEKGFNRGI